MKKIISLLLVTTVILSMFAGCAKGIGKNEEPITEPPTEAPEAPTTTESISITGMFYRTDSGDVVLLSEMAGPIVLRNDAGDFEEFLDFALVKIETEVIMESYPAQTTATKWELVAERVDNEAWPTYQNMLDEMVNMGYIPLGESALESDFQNAPIHMADYDIIATIMDKAESENVLFSPLSLNFALGMLANAADEAYLNDFEKYFNMPLAMFNDFVRSYMKDVHSNVEETTISIANALWLKDGLILNREYAEIVGNNYDAAVNMGDFSDTTLTEINNWCADKTEDMIPSILDTLSPDAQTVLLNALYFDADWMEPYEEHMVRDTEFTNANGEQSVVSGLHCRENTSFYENEAATAFAKYYDDGRYAFVGILPKVEGDFTLTSLDIESLMNNREFYEVNSMIPKFEFNNTHALLPLLDAVDLPIASYSYGNIVENTTLSVDNAIQKTAIKVTESGTTAAAVTAIEMDAMMAPSEPVEVKEIILNRPFAFMIYDMATGTPLFVGKVANI